MGLRVNIVISSLLLNYYLVWVFVLPRVPLNSPLHGYFPDRYYALLVPFVLSTFSVCTISTYLVFGIYKYCQGRRARRLSLIYQSRMKEPIDVPPLLDPEPAPAPTPSPLDPAPIDSAPPDSAVTPQQSEEVIPSLIPDEG